MLNLHLATKALLLLLIYCFKKSHLKKNKIACVISVSLKKYLDTFVINCN